MKNNRRAAAAATLGVLCLTTWLFAKPRAQEPVPEPVRVVGEETAVLAATPEAEPLGEEEIKVDHADCAFFAPDRDKWTNEILSASRRDRFWRSKLTNDVEVMLSSGKPSRFSAAAAPERPSADARGTIDRHIFGVLESQGITPAERTNDYEFVRRVTLDLTGRVPTREKTLAFVTDATPDRRAKLVDELLSSPEWVDKWTLYFGDKLRNSVRNNNVQRGEQGRNAFNAWIRASLTENKKYNTMVGEAISATSANSWIDGEANFLIGYRVTGGPIQDVYDAEMAGIAETFLGMAHLNCVLCHDGRGHLDSLSLWGRSAKRYDAWATSSFLSRTNLTIRRPDPASNNVYYWSLLDTGARDYSLNTTTGNRPERKPVAGQAATVAPKYMFSGATAKSGEPYRVTLAREVTNDFQFARATVNYMWAEFFSRGIVEPANQFDPARLDPDKAPPEGWTLQPSNARLLNELAAEFQKSGYDLRWLMKTLATSEAYQMSSRYNGTWKTEYEPLFARKLVRRLWAEEIADAVQQTSGILGNFRYNEYSGTDLLTRTQKTINWLIQSPETRGFPDGTAGVTSQFLDSFFRGDRDEEERKPDSSVLQALNLMNDPFVMTRIRSTGTGASASLLLKALSIPDNNQMLDMLWTTVLSRLPTDAERATALAPLQGAAAATRQQRAEDLLWSLYNKVDFIFNY